MAEEALVNGSLSQEMIRVGEKLLKRLDASGLAVDAAFWLYSSEASTWRLIVGAPTVHLEGPRSLYKRIASELRRLGEPGLSIGDISVVDTADPLIQLLRAAVRTGRGISGIRFSRNTVKGTFIPDAYIYRVA